MATLQDAIDQLAAKLAGVDGVRQAPEEPPEQMNVYPFVVCRAGSGSYRIGPPQTMRGLHNIIVELHVARKDLPRDVQLSMPYGKDIPMAILELYQAGLWTAVDAISGEISYEFGPMFWGGVRTFGFRFTIAGVKTMDEVALAVEQAYDETRGYVIFEFADGQQSHRLLAEPALRAYGWGGVAFVPTHIVNGQARLSDQDIKFLDLSGWDVCSHGYGAGLVSAMDDGALENHLALSKESLQALGVRRGVRVYGPPQGIIVQREYDRAIQYYDWVRLSMGQPLLNLPHDDELAYGTQGGDDATSLATIQAAIDLCVNDPARVLILTFHDIIDGTATGLDTSLTRLNAIIAYVLASKANVVVYSDIIDRRVPVHREFGDNFEAGTLAAWDSVVGSPTANASAAAHGSYGLRMTLDGQYVVHGFPQMARAIVRLYVNPDLLTATHGSSIQPVRLRDGSVVVGLVTLAYSSTTGWRVGASILANGGVWHDGATRALGTGWHCVEVSWHFAADGGQIVWVDETSQDVVEDIAGNNYVPDGLQVGRIATAGTVTGILYVDDVVVDKQNHIGLYG